MSYTYTGSHTATTFEVRVNEFFPPYSVYNTNFGYTTRTVAPVEVYNTVTQAQFESAMDSNPVPLGVPQVWPLPNFGWPVEVPILNPSSAPSPVPQSLRIPQGLPVPVSPATSPETYKTPVIDVIPANSPSAPWQVDVQPKDVISTSPDPLPDTQPVPDTPPDGGTDTPREDTPDLCATNPDIAACAHLDTPDGPELDTIEKPVTVIPDTGWGAENAACPAARHITVQGRDIPIPFDLFCQYMAGIRPMVIGMAWLSAGFILLGARGGD